jgi:hypothetical protein
MMPSVWPVRHSIRDQFVTEDAAGAGLVFDDHRLAEPVLHRVRENAPDNVGAATGAEGNDDVDGLLRP